jgi:hypothetical protein
MGQYIIGGLKFMETKLTIVKGYIVLLASIFLLSTGYANELEKIQVNFLPSEDGERNGAERSDSDPLKGLDVSYDKIFSYQNNKSKEIKNRSIVQSNSLEETNRKNLSLGPNEFIEIKAVDKIRKLFNGSIIVKFNQVPDLYWFASQNNLQFVSDLSDINRGVFKIGNIYDLEEIIRNLQNKVEVQSVELDVIDPSIEFN